MAEIVNFLEKLVDVNPKAPILQESFDERKIGLTPAQMKVLRSEIERYKATKSASRFASFLAANKTHKTPDSISEMDKLEETFELTEE